MKSSGLLAIPDGIRTPRESKEIQKIILALHQVLTRDYGVRSVPFELFADLVNEATTTRGMSPLALPAYPQYFRVISERVSRGPPAFQLEGNALVLEPITIEWDDFDLQPIVLLVESKSPIKL